MISLIRLSLIILFFVIEYITVINYKSSSSWKNNIHLITVFTLLITLYFIVLPIKFAPFTIPNILLFTSIFLFIWIDEYEQIIGDFPTFIFIIVIIFSYIIAGLVFFISVDNITKNEKEKTSSCEIISISALNNGEKYNEPVYVLFCEETSEYKFYTKNEDGSIVHNNIPADEIKMYFIEENDIQPYIDTFLSKVYTTNKYYDFEILDEEITTYNLYIQKDYLKTIYFLNEENDISPHIKQEK